MSGLVKEQSLCRWVYTGNIIKYNKVLSSQIPKWFGYYGSQSLSEWCVGWGLIVQYLINGSQSEATLPLRGHLKMSGDTFGCHNWAGAIDIPPNKELCSSKCQ